MHASQSDIKERAEAAVWFLVTLAVTFSIGCLVGGLVIYLILS